MIKNKQCSIVHTTLGTKTTPFQVTVLRSKWLNLLFDCRNGIQKLCRQIVSSVPFEVFIYVLILLNIIPIMLDSLPTISSKFHIELSVMNYIFFTCYVAEAVLKVGGFSVRTGVLNIEAVVIKTSKYVSTGTGHEASLHFQPLEPV